MSDCCGFATFNKAKICLQRLKTIMNNQDLNEKKISPIESDARFYNHTEYNCVPSSVLFKSIKKGLKKRSKFENMDKHERNALAMVICQFISTIDHIYFDCIQCGIGIKLDHSEKIIYCGDYEFLCDDYNSSNEEYEGYCYEPIPGFNEPENDKFEIMYRNKKHTNILYYWFNYIPSYDGLSWLGVGGAGNVGKFNVMNYNRMIHFVKTFRNNCISTHHMLSIYGPVCDVICFKNALFGNTKLFGDNIGQKIAHEFVKDIKEEIPTIPIVIQNLIGKYISIP